jgi:hypothetical protein
VAGLAWNQRHHRHRHMLEATRLPSQLPRHSLNAAY